jgi:integrase
VEDPFFPSFRASTPTSREWTYGRARTLFKQLLKDCRLPDHFGFHSLRAGGTTAATNAGASESAIMKHGGWRNTNVMSSRYVTLSNSQRLSVTEPLLQDNC